MSSHEDRSKSGERIGQVRRLRFGEDGIPELVASLNIPARTWENYESGVTIPDLILLRFVCLRQSDPAWLLTGEGEPFRPSRDAAGRQNAR